MNDRILSSTRNAIAGRSTFSLSDLFNQSSRTVFAVVKEADGGIGSAIAPLSGITRADEVLTWSLQLQP